MAYDKNKLTKLGALEALANRVKTELDEVKQETGSALKSGKVDGNTVNLYTTSDSTGTAAFSFDIPEELFLEQTKTAFAGNFAWSAETYPGSTDPELNDKPVMVLAVEGEGGTTNYSFLDMAKLVDTYTAKVEGKDASTTVEIAGYEVNVKVNISAAEGNQLQLRPDGLYVAKTEVEVATDEEVSEMLTGVFGS